jgi:hypothetical protein
VQKLSSVPFSQTPSSRVKCNSFLSCTAELLTLTFTVSEIYWRGFGKLCLQIHIRNHTECCVFTFSNSNSHTSGHQYDGATPHFVRHVMEVFCATFPGRWAGRDGSILWPPRNPDMIPLDFLFWGCVNNYIYMDTVRDQNHLAARIRVSRWAGKKRYATVYMARSGISSVQGHERWGCGNILIAQNYMRYSLQ